MRYTSSTGNVCNEGVVLTDIYMWDLSIQLSRMDSIIRMKHLKNCVREKIKIKKTEQRKRKDAKYGERESREEQPKRCGGMWITCLQ